MSSEILIINCATIFASLFMYKPIKKSLGQMLSDYIQITEYSIANRKVSIKDLEKEIQILEDQEEKFSKKKHILLDKAKIDAENIRKNGFKQAEKELNEKIIFIESTFIQKYNETCNKVLIKCLDIITHLLLHYIKSIDNINGKNLQIENINQNLLNMIRKE